ncbi:MAG: LytS/YhcK type 5TM receptor domain-containing protein, partial [Bacillota bacterium]|nr:LytS/YhcK type 5TM receptor domain-containing protein [Bacillota bacterium]
MVLLKLVVATLLPVFLAIFFCLAENKKEKGFARLPERVKQVIIGVSFGCLAVFSTEYGIETQGVILNVRDAAPLTAGLLFGAPSGIIAGLIGGVERWFAVYWGAGEFSRLSCTLATIVAGLFGGWIRVFLLDNKRASWFYGLAVGVTTEVLHMILLFITKMSTDIERAFYVVQHCSMPMIIANGVSVMLAAMAVSFILKERQRPVSKDPEKIKISYTFQTRLMVCVLLAFSLTGLFTYTMQTKIAYTNIDSLLSTCIEDVREDIIYSSDHNLLTVVRTVAAEFSEDDNIENSELEWIAEKHDLQEVNIVDSNGIVIASSAKEVIGFDMKSKEETAEFMQLLDGETEFVQDLRTNSFGNSDEGLWKFAGASLPGDRFIQVGYKAERFQKDIDMEVSGAAKNRHVGKTGCNIICNAEGVVVSDRGEMIGEKIDLKSFGGGNTEEGVRFEAEIHGEEVFCMYSRSEGYYIVSVLPQKEGMFTRDVALYLLLFMELLVFATLFALIAYLVKKIVVDNIRRVNESLGQITGGNLDVKINVRTNEEFASLSDDINSTVITLKRYIEEAAARIDQELLFAKKIQHSALPSVFPPYPNRKDFGIYAMMDTAKEVGGDFYDFYMLGEDKLVFIIADVSGKGIPAAMFMMTAKTLIKSYTESGAEVNDVFTMANNKLCESNEAEMFVTAWMGILDLRTGVITYTNAGHNPPVLRKKNGTFAYFKSKGD